MKGGSSLEGGSAQDLKCQKNLALLTNGSASRDHNMALHLSSTLVQPSYIVSALAPVLDDMQMATLI